MKLTPFIFLILCVVYHGAYAGRSRIGGSWSRPRPSISSPSRISRPSHSSPSWTSSNTGSSSYVKPKPSAPVAPHYQPSSGHSPSGVNNYDFHHKSQAGTLNSGYPSSHGISGSSGTGSAGSHSYPKSPGLSGSSGTAGSPGYPSSSGLSGTGHAGANSGHTYPSSNGMSGSSGTHTYPAGTVHSGTSNVHTYPSGASGHATSAHVAPVHNAPPPYSPPAGGYQPHGSYSPYSSSGGYHQPPPPYSPTGGYYHPPPTYTGHTYSSPPVYGGYGGQPTFGGYTGITNYSPTYITHGTTSHSNMNNLLLGLAVWNAARSTGHSSTHHYYHHYNQNSEQNTKKASELSNCTLTMTNENGTNVLLLPCEIATSFAPNPSVVADKNTPFQPAQNKELCTISVVRKGKTETTQVPCDFLNNLAANATQPDVGRLNCAPNPARNLSDSSYTPCTMISSPLDDEFLKVIPLAKASTDSTSTEATNTTTGVSLSTAESPTTTLPTSDVTTAAAAGMTSNATPTANIDSRFDI